MTDSPTANDYMWILAPSVERRPLSSLGKQWLERNHVEIPDLPGERFYIIHRPNSRADPIIVNQLTSRLADEFRRPTSFLQALIRLSESCALDPERILPQCKETVSKLVGAEVLVRAPQKNSNRLRAVAPQLSQGQPFLQYRIVMNLHRTSDTEIYKVEDHNGKFYALKIMGPLRGSVRNRRLVKDMLFNEFEALSSLRGTPACELVQSGQYRSRPYAILEWINGVPLAHFASALRDQIDREEAAWSELFGLVERCIKALATIHDRGYMHGDIHPGNFLVEKSYKVRILDFGLARSVGRELTTYRKIGGGVVPFLSPEAATAILDGQNHFLPTVESETYSLSAVIFYLLTGRYPLVLSVNREEALAQIGNLRVRSFKELDVDSMPAVEKMLAKGLGKAPYMRYHSASAMLTAFRLAVLDLQASTSVTRRHDPKKQIRAFLESRVKSYLQFLGEMDYAGLEATDEPPHASLAFGGAGIAYALLRASQFYNEPDLLAQARLWVDRSLANCDKDTAFASPEFGLDADAINNGSVYYGLAGIHFVRALVANAANDISTADSSIEAFFKTITDSGSISAELLSGRAGQLLATAHLQAQAPKEALEQMGRRLYKDLASKPSTKFAQNGFAHGWAGIAFAVLEWSKVSNTPLPYEFILELTNFARSRNRDLIKVQRSSERKVAAGYVNSWCNGNPGMALLWTDAHEVTQNPIFLQAALESGTQVKSNLGGVSHLCCGLGGQAYALLALSRLQPKGPWHEEAVNLVIRAFDEERFEYWKNSLFKGKSGVMCLALDLLNTNKAHFPALEVEI